MVSSLPASLLQPQLLPVVSLLLSTFSLLSHLRQPPCHLHQLVSLSSSPWFSSCIIHCHRHQPWQLLPSSDALCYQFLQSLGSPLALSIVVNCSCYCPSSYCSRQFFSIQLSLPSSHAAAVQVIVASKLAAAVTVTRRSAHSLGRRYRSQSPTLLLLAINLFTPPATFSAPSPANSWLVLYSHASLSSCLSFSSSAAEISNSAHVATFCHRNCHRPSPSVTHAQLLHRLGLPSTLLGNLLLPALP